MKTIEEYFKDAVREELNTWLCRVGAPYIDVMGITLLTMEYRHRREGVKWEAMFTGGLTGRGWISLDLAGFDMDERPDA